MVVATQGADIIKRARKSDKDFDALMAQVDRFGGNVHLIRTLQKSAEVAYDQGYLSGYLAAQSGVRSALGIVESD